MSWPSIQIIDNVSTFKISLKLSLCSTAKRSLSNFIPNLYSECFMLCKKAVYNGLSLKLNIPFDFQLRI